MLKIVECILEFNQLNQSEQGLKILTPNQMLNRLPISLGELNAGNKSQKLRNKNQAAIIFSVQIKKTYKKYL